jgi:hypothetical protein
MQAASLKILTEAVETRFGFLMAEDVAVLAADPATRNLKVLLRCDAERPVVPMHRVEAEVERVGHSLRDVALTASECRRLREHG